MADENINSGISEGSESAVSGGEGTGAASTPEYLSKSDFDAFRQEFTQTISRLTPKQEAAREAAGNSTPDAPKKPNLKDYDFAKDPEAADRYQADYYKFLRHGEKQQEAADKEKSQSAEKIQQNERGHRSRLAEYAKENPSFNTDLKAAAGKINVTDPVAHAIYASKNSALIVHYMAKNPGADQDLNILADSEGPEAVRERLGEMAYEMRAEQKSLTANAEAAGQRIPRQNLRGAGNNNTENPKDYAARFKSFRQ